MLGEVKGMLRGVKVVEGTYDATKEVGMLVEIEKDNLMHSCMDLQIGISWDGSYG